MSGLVRHPDYWPQREVGMLMVRLEVVPALLIQSIRSVRLGRLRQAPPRRHCQDPIHMVRTSVNRLQSSPALQGKGGRCNVLMVRLDIL